MACQHDQHDFAVKVQKTSLVATDQFTNVTEVYCRKCATVCFLTPSKPDQITGEAYAT
jgi:hypothetical protein